MCLASVSRMQISYATRITLLAFVLMMSCNFAQAGEFSAIINGKSYHLGASDDWNEDNYGLGLEYEFASETRWRKRLMANGFRDSNEEMSYMLGGGLHRNLFSTERLGGFYVDAGINAFFMTRKEVNDNEPFPGVLPSLTLGNSFVGMNLTYLPKKAVEKFTDTRMSDESVDGIIFLQFKVNMGR